MSKITVWQKVRYQKKLDKLKEELPEVIKRYQTALSYGDLSENSEYDAAKAEKSVIKSEIAKLEELVKSEIIEYDKSPIITVGSLIRLSSPSLDKELLLLVVDNGDPIIDGVLNTSSEVGKFLIGKLSGDYTIGSYYFHAEKVISPDPQEFIEMYPEESEVITSLFKEV